MSRPSESVPSQCSGEGGRRRWARSWTSGSYGAITGAKSAQSANTAMSASARRLRGFARIGARAASLKPRAETATALTTRRPGIEPEVRDVDHEVRERIHDRRQQGDAEHRREVERDGGRGRITPEPGPAEDRLGQHRPREKASEGETEDRDGRDERVAQPVAQDDEPLREALGPRGPHVVLADDIEHARPRHPRDHRRREVTEGECGQHEMKKAAAESLEVARDEAVDDEQPRPSGRRRNERIDASTTRQPAKLVVEKADHDQTEPKDRNGASDQRKHSNQVVGKAAAKYGRPHAGGNADDDRNDEGRERKLDRGGERVEEVVGHRAARADASTEIAVYQTDDIGEVLLG